MTATNQLAYNYVSVANSSTQAFAFVEGRYFLEVSVHGYSNPTGTCRDCSVDGQRVRGCCDRFRTTDCSGDLLCDSFFTYCVGSDDGGCVDPLQQRTSAVNINDGPVNFSQSTVLGLENPLILQGLTHAYRVCGRLLLINSACHLRLAVDVCWTRLRHSLIFSNLVTFTLRVYQLHKPIY